MFKIRHRAAFVALVFVCVLAACDDAPSEPQERAPAAKKSDPPPRTANLSKDMVAAVQPARHPASSACISPCVHRQR